MIAIVIDVAPDKYQSVLTAVQNVKGKELTLMDLEIVMGQSSRPLTSSQAVKSGKETGEVLLSVFNGV